MARTILLDANVIDQINRGNTAAATALTGMIKNGDTVYIAKQAYNELITNSLPRAATANRLLLERLDIQVAPAGSMAQRVDVYAQNQTRNGTVVSTPDSLVAANAKAIQAELWSFDGPFRTNAAVGNRLGVRVAPESTSIPLVGSGGAASAPADYRVGHRLVGLPPTEISVSGEIIRRGPAGAPARAMSTMARVGVADNRLPMTGGPSPSGTAAIGGITLALQGMNFVLNRINDEVQGRRAREALAQIEPVINGERAANPSLGVVLVFFYRQVEAPPESLLRPGAAFMHVEYALGQTEDEAVQNWAMKPSIRAGARPGEHIDTQKVWIPPIVASPVTSLRTPFPIAAIGTFASPGLAKLQEVEWGGITGFDDEGETTLRISSARPPLEFAILKPPSVLPWSNGRTWLETEIPLTTRVTADGSSVLVVDLDPWVPGHVSAAMVFPADDRTAEAFAHTRATKDNLGLLRGHVNFGRVRWVRPEQIRVLRQL